VKSLKASISGHAARPAHEVADAKPQYSCHPAHRPLKLAALLCAVMMAGLLHAQEISPAEKILFQADHLQNVAAPQALRYRYLRKDQAGTGFSDQVVVDVGARGNDGASASVRFLSGERQLVLPAVEGVHGNPALLGFLERDIVEMKRLTGGSANYFRKRIRIAFAEAASVEPVAISYRGQSLQGTKVSIQPYLNDPMQEKMRAYVGKRYVFILGDGIPGAVYQLASVVPGEPAGGGKAGPALIEETMTLEASPR